MAKRGKSIVTEANFRGRQSEFNFARRVSRVIRFTPRAFDVVKTSIVTPLLPNRMPSSCGDWHAHCVGYFFVNTLKKPGSKTYEKTSGGIKTSPRRNRGDEPDGFRRAIERWT